jgi:hypothetical protein
MDLERLTPRDVAEEAADIEAAWCGMAEWQRHARVGIDEFAEGYAAVMADLELRGLDLS